MAVDVGTYELVWPTGLFVSEARRIADSAHSGWTSRAEWLLTEAFSGASAVSDFQDAENKIAPSGWGQPDPWGEAKLVRSDQRREWFNELISHASQIRHAASPRPYWPQRRAAKAAGVENVDDGHLAFARTIADLEKHGYLAEVFGEDCVDDPQELPDASKIIELRLGIPGLWPLTPATWDEDTFYGLVEVFHDLVSRPRNRTYHSWDQCGWHHSEFHAAPARALYTWKINQLLLNAGTGYELASEGEDCGRLVAVTDDGRADLVHRALHNSEPDVRERVEHAVALFRSRSASRESKRSAIVALAGLLEERRQLIRDSVGRQDEGALFEIANRFEIRHRHADQRGDYDAAFLDWIFWWYLATVELTNRVIAQQSV